MLFLLFHSVGVQLPSQVSSYTNTDTDNSTGTAEVSTKINSCQKELFKQPAETPVKLSSPNTPPQELPFYQTEKSMSSIECSHQETQYTNINNIPSCSVTSSKQVILISPYKKAGYYSVERRHQQLSSTSPMKSSPNRLGKREHVKSRLDFDSSEFLPPTTSNTENVSIEELENVDIFGDSDLLQICDDFSFSEFLDFDLDYLPCQPSSSSSTDLTHW